jgi:hypothetical protein
LVASRFPDLGGFTVSAPDPTQTDPDKYKVIPENDRVRVLEYRDKPGAKTEAHQYPNSVVLMLSDFQRRLTVGNDVREVTVKAGQALWSPAQARVGENIGTTGLTRGICRTERLTLEVRQGLEAPAGGIPLPLRYYVR